MYSAIEMSREGMPLRVYHATQKDTRVARDTWTHPYEDKPRCRVCAPGKDKGPAWVLRGEKA